MSETKEIDLRENLKVAVQNDFIRAIVDCRDSNSQKFIRMAIAQSRMNDKEFFEYRVTAPELAEAFNVSTKNIYQHIDRWTTDCMKAVVKIEKPKSKTKWKKWHIFQSCEYDEGNLYMKLDQDMTPFILELKSRLGFTQYELANIFSMKGKYSIRVYEMIVMKMRNQKVFADNTVEITLSLDELRRQTMTADTYKQIVEFKRYVWNKSISEIEKAQNWKIEVTDIKKGRTVTGFNLKICSQNGWNYMNHGEKADE